MNESRTPEPDPFTGLPDEIVATYVDPDTGLTNLVHRDIAWQQMTRESPRFAEEFDRTFKADVDEISREYAIATGIIRLGGANVADEADFEVHVRCGAILQNALVTVLGGLELLRRGYVLQPSILVRSCIEAVATVFDVFRHEESRTRLMSGNYDSSDSIGRAKKLFRIIGPLYGRLSKSYTHIGEAHWTATAFSSTSAEAREQLVTLKAAIALVSLAVELVHHQSVQSPRYWKPHPDGNGVIFHPDANDVAVLKDFVRIKSDGAAQEEPERLDLSDDDER
jgi:hypothetical protein